MNNQLRPMSSIQQALLLSLLTLAIVYSLNQLVRANQEQANQRSNEALIAAKQDQKITLRGLTPFEFGTTHTFKTTQSGDANEFRPLSLRFIPVDDSQHFREMWSRPELIAEMRFPLKAAQDTTRGKGLLLAMYDESRSPLYALTIPAAAIASNGLTADVALKPLLERNRLWLRSADDPTPKVTYSFHLQTERIDASLPSTNDAVNRGITFQCALDAILRSPDKWRVPVAFSADWNGRSVQVLGLTGPSAGQVFGSGLTGGYIGGYSVTTSRSVILVIDATTGFPLLERSERMEFEFHDDVEASPGQHAPLQILCRTDSMQMDLRFQIAENKLWIFDRKAESRSPAYIDHLQIDGVIPVSMKRSTLPDCQEPFPEFPWEQLKDRRPIRSDDSISASVAASEKPWTNPAWETVSRLSIDSSEDIVCRLRIEPRIGIPRYWSLTRLSEGRAQELSCEETGPSVDASHVATALLQFDQSTPVAGPKVIVPDKVDKTTRETSEAHQTRVTSVKARRDQTGDLLLTPEILSTNRNTDQMVLVTLLIVNSEGVAIRGATGRDSFRTLDETVTRQDCCITLSGDDNVSGKLLLVGTDSVVTAMPIGSAWGRFAYEDPLFEPENLLPSRFPIVREIGLQQLYRTRWYHFTDQFHSRHSRRSVNENRAEKVIEPFTLQLKSVLSNKDGDTEPAIAIACRLAGFSQDRGFVEQLQANLNHPSVRVRDSAAIGLGLLGSPDGLPRLRELAARSRDENSATEHPFANLRFEEVQWALERLEK